MIAKYFVLHDPEGTPLPPLEELGALVQSEVDAFALTIGLLMDKAQRRNVRKFGAWVEMSTPFTLAEAERLRAVAVSYRDLPKEVIVSLPRPSSALSFVFEDVSNSSFLSATAGFSREDIIAGGLLGGHPENLSADVRALLSEWLGQALRDGGSDASP